ncbi:MAG TPA: choice-of-anchor Q domain-containing protein [Puia sp.]|nr:choice-of-anchor Q domain-containing protein [Puia sp.]
MHTPRLFILLFVALALFSCRKDSFITSKDAIVRLSADTLFFDTVFVSTGSITETVKIINGNDQKLRLSDVKLMGGDQSFFSININGAPGPRRQNVEIEAGDSIYIFVAVSIQPNAANLPFVIEDSIQIAFNGVNQYIQLQAWGQNAHFLRNQVIRGNVTWDKTLPYVILGGLQVDTNATLTIPAGSRIYLHADAPFLVDGSLQIQGAKSDGDHVTFRGDRMDDPYRDFPGGWPGIYFRPTSKNNTLEYTTIKNAYQAIVATGSPLASPPQLTLNQCIIDNSYDAGILGLQSSIRANNCLISNCGKNIVLGYGGNYQFQHCTSVGFSNDYISHSQPVLAVSNYITQDDGTSLNADLSADFINCIFWGASGTVDNEVQVSRQGSGSLAYHVGFSNCDWKIKTAPADATMANMIANADPLFDSVNNSRRYYDFHLRAASPLIDKGIGTTLTLDLDGNPRPVGLPDLGCYEHQ